MTTSACAIQVPRNIVSVDGSKPFYAAYYFRWTSNCKLLCRLATTVVVACCLTTFPPKAWSQTNDLATAEDAAFRNAVAIASPCVVQIETFGGLERVGDATIAESPTTGTIVGEDGWIVVSSYSFQNDPASILVTLPSGERTSAKLTATDFNRELSLLKIKTDTKLPTATPADRTSIEVGQWAIALGKTYSKDTTTQSIGIVSALGRAYGKALQTDAKVSPLNYGGPLINLQGETLGILAPVSPGTFLESDSSEIYDSGIGFAIPLQDILDRLPTLQAGTDIRVGKLGMVTQTQIDLAGPVILTGAVPGSPASKAGVKTGDVVVEAQGQQVRKLADLKHALHPVDAGQTFQLSVLRDGQPKTLTCELASEIPVYRRRMLGVRCRAEENRVIIDSVVADSPAAKSGQLMAGDTIVRCNGVDIKEINDLVQAVAVAETDRESTLTIKSAEKQTDVSVTVATWPTELPKDSSTSPMPKGENITWDVKPLVIGEAPNEVIAILPKTRPQSSLGLVVLFMEPGEWSQEAFALYWQKFAKEHGWIVVAIRSADAKSWTRDEFELAARCFGIVDNEYKLDPLRLVVGGIGVGGRLGLLAGASEPRKFHAVLTLGTQLQPLALRTQNMPMTSVDFLFVGNAKELEPVVEPLTKAGYVANAVDVVEKELEEQASTVDWNRFPASIIQNWLEGLSRI